MPKKDTGTEIRSAKTQTAKTSRHEFPSAETAQSRMKVGDQALFIEKLRDVQKLLWFPKGANKGVMNARVVQALEFYESLEPSGGAEGMLALQMVGSHEAALECLRRASSPDQSPKGRDMDLKNAQRLMSLFAQQFAALDKHRGKGQQKVTVEYVNVHAGAQAIVGNVETGASKRSGVDADSVIDHSPEVSTETPGQNIRTRKRKK